MVHYNVSTIESAVDVAQVRTCECVRNMMEKVVEVGA